MIPEELYDFIKNEYIYFRPMLWYQFDSDNIDKIYELVFKLFMKMCQRGEPYLELDQKNYQGKMSSNCINIVIESNQLIVIVCENPNDVKELTDFLESIAKKKIKTICLDNCICWDSTEFKFMLERYKWVK